MARRKSQHGRRKRPAHGRGRSLHFELLEAKRLLTADGLTEDDQGAPGPTDTDLPAWRNNQNFLFNPSSYLTDVSAGEPAEIALDFIQANVDRLGLAPGDVDELQVTNSSTSEHNQLTHIYFQQQFQGLDIHRGIVNVAVTADGRILSVGSQLIRDLSARISQQTPALSASQAVEVAGANAGLTKSGPWQETSQLSAASGDVVVTGAGLPPEGAAAKLMYDVHADGSIRKVWHTVIRSSEDWGEITVDAASGEILRRTSWESNFSYNVFASPLGDPDDGGRSIVQEHNVYDATASPYGWHDTNGFPGHEYTTTQGNNVWAVSDRQAETPLDRYLTDISEIEGFYAQSNGNQAFNFSLDLDDNPVDYQEAAVTNLFYWSNVLHDIHYQYGFDEAAGNFQMNNYGNGGIGGDPVVALAQNGAGTGSDEFLNDSFMTTPPDGQPPTMQMYVIDSSGSRRDADLQNEIIIHEYGHGISVRLTGGPSNSNSLDASQSGGLSEGWSDWWAIMLTQKVTDTQFGQYPVGAWVSGNPDGVRNFPYSYDMDINPLTFGDYNSIELDDRGELGTWREIHDSGEIWASALWDLNWLLINGDGGDIPAQGFDSDFYNGTGGNNVALQLVMDGLKLQPSLPTYLDARDAILLADLQNYGGANQLAIWTAFARRGLGASASDGGDSNSLFVVEAFDMPPLGPYAGEDFEGNLDAWQIIGDASILDSSIGTDPAEGLQQGGLTTINSRGGNVTDASMETFLGLAPGSLDALNGGNATSGSAMKQAILVEAGDRLTFEYNFATDELSPELTNNDFAFFTVNGPGVSELMELADTSKSDLDPDSVDGDEITIGGPGVGSAVLTGNVIRQGGDIYRYEFEGSFVDGSVNVNFLPGTFQDQDGNNNVADSESFEVDERGITASRVRVRRTNFGYIHLAEVRVFDASTGVNLAESGVASQSSTYDSNSGAERANDGNTTSNYPVSVSHTQKEVGAWWEVDLGEEFSVGGITVYNRPSDGFDLEGAIVEAYDDQGNVVWSEVITGTFNGSIHQFDINGSLVSTPPPATSLPAANLVNPADGGTIDLETLNERGYLEVSFADQGSGLSPSPSFFNESTGYQNYTYTFPNSGIYTIGFGVSDMQSTSTDSGLLLDSLTMLLGDPNTAPQLETIADRSVSEGSTLIFTAAASDNDTPAQSLTFSLDAASVAAGMTINATTGQFSWTPSETQGPGVYSVTVRVRDDGVPSLTDTETFDITVSEINVAPQLSSIGNRNATEGVAFSVSVSATDADRPNNTLTYSLDSGSRAAGMSINPNTGQLSWTPSETQGGNVFPVTVTVVDNGSPNLSDFETFNITVAENNIAPVLSSIGNQNVTEGNLLSFTASATDADSPTQSLTFSLDAASRAAGMTINANTGQFAWTPTEAQGPDVFSVTVTVTDNGSPIRSDFETFDITVAEVNAEPLLAAIGNKSVDEGQTLSFTATATDADRPNNTLTYSLDSASRAAGMTINASSGQFNWTPTEAQGPNVFSVTVTVTDNGSPTLSDFETFNITVAEVNAQPELAEIGNRSVLAGDTLSFAAVATDDDDPANGLTFSLDAASLTAGMTIHPTSGQFSWTPGAAHPPETIPVTVTVTDNGSPNLSDFETFNITVAEVNAEPQLAAIGNQSVNEGQTLIFTATATDADVLTYRLDAASLAAGMTINASTGQFAWTPTEAQGPDVFSVTVTVTDNGSPNLSDFETFNITVAEVNIAPVLGAIGDQGVTAGETLSLTATATDADQPANGLTFSLDAASLAAGMTINPTTGQFSWTPSGSQAPDTLPVTVTVTDNGPGTLSDFETFNIAVATVIEEEGFESGPGGWQAVGDPLIISGGVGETPAEGNQQAALTTVNSRGGNSSDSNIEAFLGLTSGMLDSLSVGDATAGSAMRQTITVAAGYQLRFQYNFLTSDQTNGDFVFFSVSGDGVEEAVKLVDTESGVFGPSGSPLAESTGYLEFVYDFENAGDFTIGIGVVDLNSTSVDSAVLVDDVSYGYLNLPTLLLPQAATGNSDDDDDGLGVIDAFFSELDSQP